MNDEITSYEINLLNKINLLEKWSVDTIEHIKKLEKIIEMYKKLTNEQDIVIGEYKKILNL